jgi:DNA-binding transcriptional LysR family regulator
MFDLNDLALFVHVANKGSFSAAARHLGMPANTLSRRIDQLETQLEVRLLLRSTRKLSLSTEGQELYDRCAPLLEQIFEIQRQKIEARSPSGVVRIAAMGGFFEIFRMEWLDEFYSLYPQISIELILSDVPTDLIADRIDLAFRVGVSTSTGHRVKKLAPMSMILVASPSYLAKHPEPSKISELTDHYCLTTVSQKGRNTWNLHGPKGNQEIEIRSRFAANDMRVLVQACVAGFGIALVPMLLVNQHILDGKLIHILPNVKRENSDLGLQLVYTSRPPVSPAVAIFAEFLSTKLKSGDILLNIIKNNLSNKND